MRTCPPGLMFHFATAGCLAAAEVECGDRMQVWRGGPGDTRPRHQQHRHQEAARETTASSIRAPASADSVPSDNIEHKSAEVTITDDPLADLRCEGGEVYVVPDPSHCDRYLLCPEAEISLCPAGRTLDTTTGFCAPRAGVACGDRHLNMRDNTRELEERLLARIRQLGRATSATQTSAGTSSSPVESHGNVGVKANSGSRPMNGKTAANLRSETIPEAPAVHTIKDEGARSSPGNEDCAAPGVYRVADPGQCDQYTECRDGVRTVLRCPSGLAFSAARAECDLLARVDCGPRRRLQAPGPARASPLCPRRDGLFPVPRGAVAATDITAAALCSRYVHCSGGLGTVLRCGAGAVFDEVLGCVHPDQTER